MDRKNKEMILDALLDGGSGAMGEEVKSALLGCLEGNDRVVCDGNNAIEKENEGGVSKKQKLSEAVKRATNVKVEDGILEKERLSEVLNRVSGVKNGSRSASDETVRGALIKGLDDESKAVFDAKVKGGEKRNLKKGGEEEECKAKDPTKCWKHGFVGDILNRDRKEYARKIDRINPPPTRELEKEMKVARELREIGWDIGDAPDSKNETQNMIRDLDNLRREAGMKKLDETFAPYAEHRRKWEEYEEIKKQAKELHKTAQIAVARHRNDMALEIIETLKTKPQEIRDKYEEVLDSYDELCNALCAEMETKGEGDEKKNPGALEVAKQGFGMMFGEDSEEWQKRQKRLGKSKEVPETIKKIDEIVAQTERRWRSVAGISKDAFDEVKKNFRQTFSNLMKRCALASNVPIAALNGILEDHLKNQHDLTEKGKHYEDGNFSHSSIIGGDEDLPRYKFTRKCFGTERGLKESSYEKYGCLHLMRPDKEDNLMGCQYGRNVIRWKPHKTVATMTFTDSLCLSRDGLNYVNPCLVTSPSPCCFNPENQEMVETLRQKPVNIGLDSMCHWAGTPYIELQLHGENQYDASAIESISFGSVSDVRNLSKTAIQKILENRIALYVREEPIMIDANGKIKKG